MRPQTLWTPHSPVSCTELLHDGISLLLWHVSVHGGDGKIGLSHLLRQPLHLPLGVTEDDRLCDCEGVIQVTQCVKLPLLLLYGNKELFDSF